LRHMEAAAAPCDAAAAMGSGRADGSSEGAAGIKLCKPNPKPAVGLTARAVPAGAAVHAVHQKVQLAVLLLGCRGGGGGGGLARPAAGAKAEPCSSRQ